MIFIGFFDKFNNELFDKISKEKLKISKESFSKLVSLKNSNSKSRNKHANVAK